jgi:hypothetical protein
MKLYALSFCFLFPTQLLDQLRSYMVNNMKKIFAWLISLIFLGSGFAYAGDYTDSAHGNSVAGATVGYGVNRSSTSQYEEGHCGHCHEQHASIDGGTPPDPLPNTGDAAGPDNFCLLAQNFDTTPSTPYDQDDNACFYCHTSSASGISLQTDVVDNKNYAATFGGATAVTTGILQAFKSTSYHNLKDVIDYADSIGSWPFTADSNPCSACHNVHIAKRSCGKPGVTYDPTKSAISKPSVHDSLWGDDTAPNERMTVYGTGYQPPYYTGGTNLEPDGLAAVKATQAGKTPDYNTFCLDCHQNEVPSGKTSVNPSTTSGYLTAIDWSSDGEKHGQKAATVYISVDAPYTAGAGALGYVLSCLDCHEPHGSPNVFLIRTGVNGGEVGSGTVTTTSSSDCTPQYQDNAADWKKLCNRCHDDDYEQIHHLISSDRPYSPSGCSACHEGGGGKDPINCSCCHYHGSSAAGMITF